jgi:hypothetical protein
MAGELLNRSGWRSFHRQVRAEANQIQVQLEDRLRTIVRCGPSSQDALSDLLRVQNDWPSARPLMPVRLLKEFLCDFDFARLNLIANQTKQLL